MQTKEGVSEANKHSHKLTRLNLHACSTCGRFVAMAYRETETGELEIEERELDLKIVSSRISRLRTTTRKYAPPQQASDTVTSVDDSCW